jgi:hypothetical protein
MSNNLKNKHMSQETQPNDQAFATPPNFSSEFGLCPQEIGLTKREYFAAMAMQGLLTTQQGYHLHEHKLSEYALSYADSLINELNKEK